MMANILPFTRSAAADGHRQEPIQQPMRELVRDAIHPSVPESADTPPDGMRWAQWMLQAQDGDRAAYHALLQAVTPHVRSITRRYLGRGEDAEDAVQDVLIIVHGIRHTYERGRPFKPWLNTIASRRCIDLLRRRTHRMRHELDTGHDPDQYPAAGQTPEETLSRQHSAGTLQQAVAALPGRQRQAIRLLRLNELTLDEAAAQSEQSVGSLKVACHRALKSLQRRLANNGHSHD